MFLCLSVLVGVQVVTLASFFLSRSKRRGKRYGGGSICPSYDCCGLLVAYFSLSPASHSLFYVVCVGCFFLFIDELIVGGAVDDPAPLSFSYGSPLVYRSY